VLLEALKMNTINFDKFMEILDRLLKEGFRLREEVYLKAVEAAKMITEQ
jgi:predicted nucleic acid-binding protein